LICCSESFNFSDYDDFYNDNFDSQLDELFEDVEVNSTLSNSTNTNNDEGGDGLHYDSEDDDEVDFFYDIDDDEEFIPLIDHDFLERSFPFLLLY